MNSAGSHSHSITDPGHTHDYTRLREERDISPSDGSAFTLPNNNPFKTDTTQSATTGISVNAAGSHSHTINNTGGDGSHENRPPYYALAYIMKL